MSRDLGVNPYSYEVVQVRDDRGYGDQPGGTLLDRSVAIASTPDLQSPRRSGLTDRTAAINLLGHWQLRAVREDGPRLQISTASAIAKASSSSTPRYRTVLSILVWPKRSCTARRFPVFR